MLIAAAAAIVLFFGGSSAGLFGELIARYAEDPMKKTIVDEQRRDLALEHLSLLKDRIKEANEQAGKAAHELSGLVKNYSSRPEDFDRLFSSVLEQRQRQVEKIWDQRSAMLSRVRPDEWKAIMDSAKVAAQKQ
jgi:hypothetical protein